MIEISSEYKDGSSWYQPPKEQITQFLNDGYAVFPQVFSQHTIDLLNDRLEFVLRGEYDTGVKPDKAPKIYKIKTPLPMKNGDDHSLVSNKRIENRHGTKKL